MATKDFLKPQNVPDAMVKYLVTNLKLSSSWVNNLKSVMKPGQEPGMMDFRLYSEADVRAKNIKVKDYASFDAYRAMVLFDGVYDPKNQTVQNMKKN
ncbi:MAG: hypothetical protein JW967_02185 [Dehalococcoidales bacterium]|nr:hypothetical protein [Dehalococcoidales bacterium]